VDLPLPHALTNKEAYELYRKNDEAQVHCCYCYARAVCRRERLAKRRGSTPVPLHITGNRQKIGVDDARLEDRVADNNAKFDITESESLLFGRNFGVGTDVQMGPNGNLYVVSLDRGVIYEVFKK
jgi:hypothetical protein